MIYKAPKSQKESGRKPTWDNPQQIQVVQIELSFLQARRCCVLGIRTRANADNTKHFW